MRTDVVLLPGLHGSTALFDGFIALAPPWARCQTISLPTNGSQSFGALADSLEPELKKLEQFVLFGESFSGPIAARLAYRLGGKVALLVLCNPLIESPVVVPSSLSSWLIRSPLASSWVVSLAMTGGDRAIAGAVIREVRRLPAAVLRARLETAASARREELARTLASPLLALLGTEDRLLSAQASVEIIRDVAGAVVALLPLPHLAAQIAPSMVWEAITDEFESAA